MVTLYTQPLCRPCERVKSKLKEAGIEFQEVNILEDDKAYSYVKNTLGAKSTPILEALGHEPILGYDPIKLKELISELRV